MLADFEIARDDTAQQTVTAMPVARGTHPYMSPEVMRGEERGAAPSDVWAVAVMLADHFFVKESPSLAAQGAQSALYTDMRREELVPQPVPGPAAPPGGLVVATREMLAVEATARPSIADVLGRPNTLQYEDAATLQAEGEAPRLRARQLDDALRRIGGGRTKEVEVWRENILDRFAPLVNRMTVAQVVRPWSVSFHGEDGIDVGGVHIELITVCCLDVERRCIEAAASNGAWRFAAGCDVGFARALGRLVSHALCQQPAIPMPLRMCSGVYQAALGKVERLRCEEHSLQWWIGKGWAQWGQERYEAHLSWLHEADPEGGLLRNYKQAVAAEMDFDGLCLDGGSQAVTEENLQWFILFTVHKMLFAWDAVEAFGEGLEALGEAHGALKALLGHEVTLRVEGQRHITGEMLWLSMAGHIDGGTTEEVEWLERVVKGLDEDKTLLLLRFVTSHLRLELDGRPRANAANERHLTVHFVSQMTRDRYPTSHTCSYELQIRTAHTLRAHAHAPPHNLQLCACCASNFTRGTHVLPHH